MFYINSDWIGGLYATPSFPGSRSGFASAGAWYSMINVTYGGYEQNSKKIIESTKKAVEELKKIKGI